VVGPVTGFLLDLDHEIVDHPFDERLDRDTETTTLRDIRVIFFVRQLDPDLDLAHDALPAQREGTAL
jgi:hypothetical protein